MADAAHALHQLARPRAAAEPTQVVAVPPPPETAVEPAVEPVPFARPVEEPVDEPVAAPYDDRRDERRRLPLAAVLAALVALGVVALGAWLVLDPGGDADPAANDDPTSTASPSGATRGSNPGNGGGDGGTASEESSAPAEPTDETEPTESAEPSDDASPAGGSAEPAAFAADYYSRLPGDVDSAWAMLSPSLQQEIGYDSFSGFWRTIDSLTVEDVRSSGAGTVDVTITYNGSETETRRLVVDETEDGTRIVDDLGPV